MILPYLVVLFVGSRGKATAENLRGGGAIVLVLVDNTKVNKNYKAREMIILLNFNTL